MKRKEELYLDEDDDSGEGDKSSEYGDDVVHPPKYGKGKGKGGIKKRLEPLEVDEESGEEEDDDDDQEDDDDEYTNDYGKRVVTGGKNGYYGKGKGKSSGKGPGQQPAGSKRLKAYDTVDENVSRAHRKGLGKRSKGSKLVLSKSSPKRDTEFESEGSDDRSQGQSSDTDGHGGDYGEEGEEDDESDEDVYSGASWSKYLQNPYPHFVTHLTLDSHQIPSIDILERLIDSDTGQPLPNSSLINKLSKYVSLTFLSLVGCGLKSLDNFPRLEKLSKLILSENEIERVPPLPLSALNFLQLSNNSIKGISDIASLDKSCPLLKRINLESNPLADNDPDYRFAVWKALPGVSVIDGENNGEESNGDEEENGEEYGYDSDEEEEVEEDEEDDDEDEEDEEDEEEEVEDGDEEEVEDEDDEEDDEEECDDSLVKASPQSNRYGGKGKSVGKKLPVSQVGSKASKVGKGVKGLDSDYSGNSDSDNYDEEDVEEGLEEGNEDDDEDISGSEQFHRKSIGTKYASKKHLYGGGKGPVSNSLIADSGDYDDDLDEVDEQDFERGSEDFNLLGNPRESFGSKYASKQAIYANDMKGTDDASLKLSSIGAIWNNSSSLGNEDDINGFLEPSSLEDSTLDAAKTLGLPSLKRKLSTKSTEGNTELDGQTKSLPSSVLGHHADKKKHLNSDSKASSISLKEVDESRVGVNEPFTSSPLENSDETEFLNV